MGVDLRWKDEDGNELAVVEDSRMLLARHLLSSEWKETQCLQFIDPYGDAVFNQRQIQLLVREMEDSLQAAADTAARKHLSLVVDVLRRAVGQVHTYVWFIGD